MLEWTNRKMSDELVELGLDPMTSNDDSNPKILSWSFLKLYSMLPTYLDGYGRLMIMRNGEEVTEIRYGTELIFGSPEPLIALVEMVKWFLVNKIKLNYE